MFGVEFGVKVFLELAGECGWGGMRDVGEPGLKARAEVFGNL